MLRFLLLPLLILTGCQTADDVAQTERARFASFNGTTMAHFMAETMVVPSNYYMTGSERVFVAFKPAPDPRFGCSMHIVTVPNGRGSNAEGWTITQIRRQGGCMSI